MSLARMRKLSEKKQYRDYLRRQKKKYRYQINDTVRVTKLKRAFQWGYEEGWQKEVFKVVDRYRTQPPTYQLSDLNDEILEGTFYERELAKVALL